MSIDLETLSSPHIPRTKWARGADTRLAGH